MAKLPSIRQILLEEFPDQSDWIGKLLGPLNTYLRTVYRILDQNITLSDNLQADIRDVEVESATPNLKIRNTLKLKPTSILIGNIRRSDGTSFTLTAAPFIQWELTGDFNIKITNIVGVTPSSTTKFKLTLVILTD